MNCQSDDEVSQVAVMIMIEFEGQRNYKDSKLLCYGTVVSEQDEYHSKTGHGGQAGLRQVRDSRAQQEEGKNQPSDQSLPSSEWFSISGGNRGTVLAWNLERGCGRGRVPCLGETRGVR